MKTSFLMVLTLFFACVSGSAFHTKPSKWKESRLYHSPSDPRWDNRIVIKKSDWPPVLTEPVHSPNKAYFYIVLWPDKTKPKPRNLKIFIGHEREKLIEIDLLDYDTRYNPKIQWINEKLIYIRIWWGRVLGTDLIYDVEKESMIYKETVHDGQTVFQQHQKVSRKNS